MAKQVRRLNKRFVMFLTIGSMVLMTIVIGILIMATRQKDPQIYADRAEASMAAGNYIEAIKQYGSAYRHSGQDPKWLIKLSEAYYQNGEVPRAMSSLKQAVTADGKLVGAQKRMLELYWELFNRSISVAMSKQVEDEADRLIGMLADSDPETDVEARKALALGYHIRGLARYNRRSEDSDLVVKATEDITRAISLMPDPDYVQSLAMISLQDAQQMIQMAGAENITPEAFDGYLERMYERVGEAERLYLSLAKVESPESDAFIVIGDFYFRTWGMIENFIKNFCDFQERRLSNSLLMINQQMGELERSGTVSVDEKRRMRQRMNNELVTIRQQIPAWTKRGMDHAEKLDACYKKAETFYTHGLEQARGKDQKVSALLSLADYYLAIQKTSEAEQLIRQAITEDPQGYRAYRQLAMVLKQQASGETPENRGEKLDEAIQVVSQRLDMPKETSGIKAKMDAYQRTDLMGVLTELYLDRKQGDDLDKADELIKLQEEQLGETATLCQFKAIRATASRDYTGAIIHLEKADKLNDGRNVLVKLMLAELYYRTGNLGAAKKAVEVGLSMDPTSVPGIRMAMAIALRLGEMKSAVQYADSILRIPGMEADVPALKVKLEGLVRDGRMDEADRVAKKVSQGDKEFNWPVEKSRVLIGQGKVNEAEQLLLGVLEQTPGERTASIYLVDLYNRQNKVSQAREVLKAALAKSPDDDGLKRLDTVMRVSDPEERAEKLREMSVTMQEASMESALSAAKEEKDPFVRAIKLMDQYLRRDDLAEAQKWLDEAVKLDANRANDMNFRFALIKGDWERAKKCVDLARNEDLDRVGGLLYDARLANAQGWEQINKNQADQAGVFFDQSVRAAEQVVDKLANDAESRALLGEGYWWLDRRSEAATQIARAISLNPSNMYALRARCVELWDRISSGGSGSEIANMFSQNLQQAYAQMPWDVWLKEKMDWLKEQIAKQQEFRGDEQEDAVKVVARREERRAKDPKDVENLVRLAWVYENREAVRDLDKAQSCYQQALAQSQTGELLGQYAGFAQRTGRMPGVEPYLKELAESLGKSGNGSGYSLLGYYYMMVRDASNAESAFTQAVKVEDVADKRIDMAVFYGQANHVDEAIEWSRKALQANPTGRQERSIRSMLINALLLSNRWDESKNEIDIFLNKYANDPEGRIYQSRLAMGQGNLSETESILNDILSGNPDYIEALDLRSKIYLYRWELEKVRADLERIQELAAGAAGLDNRINLAKLYGEMDLPVEAEQLSRQLIQEAAGQSGEWIERIRSGLILSLSSSLDEKQFEDLLIWAGNANREYWGWSYERGRFLMMKKKYKQARQAFAETWSAVAKAPMSLKQGVLESYLDSQFRAGDYSDLLKLTRQAAQEMGQATFQIMCWEAAAYLSQGQTSQGLKLYAQALAAEKNPLLIWQATKSPILKAIDSRELAAALSQEAESSGVKVALACSYFASEDYARGDAIYRQLANAASSNEEKVLYFYILGQEYTERHKYSEAVGAFEEARQLDTDNLAVLNNLSYILAEYQDKAAQALELMSSKFTAMSTNPDLLDTYGRILAKMGRVEEGLYYVAKSVWVRETSASRYHLGLLLLEQNRRIDARIQLNRAMQLVGDDAALEEAIRIELSKL